MLFFIKPKICSIILYKSFHIDNKKYQRGKIEKYHYFKGFFIELFHRSFFQFNSLILQFFSLLSFSNQEKIFNPKNDFE